MTDKFLKEIQKEERNDKVAKFFTKNRNLLKKLAIFLSILAIFLIIFNIVLNNLQEKYSAILHRSMIEEEIGNFEKSKELLEEIYNAKFAPSGVKSLAMLRYASLNLIQGKTEKALEIYEKIAFSSLNDNYIQEISGLLALKILTREINENSSAKYQEETLKKIKKIVKNSKILNLYSKEQLAIFYIKTNKNQEARKILQEIILSPKASETLKKRARDLIKLI